LQIKTKILRYKEIFPQQLAVYDYRMENLDSLTTEELKYLLEEISLAVSTRNSSGLTKMFYFSGTELVEKVGCALNFQIQGLSNALQQNAAIHDCLNEIMLKYFFLRHLV